jgi:hypothetical protein
MITYILSGHSYSPNTRPFKIIFKIARTIAPKNADQKLLTSKPGTKKVANLSISAFITKRKIPKVRIEIGRVRIFNINPSVALIKPITTAAKRADQKFLISNPGMR